MAQDLITNKAPKYTKPDVGGANTRNFPVLATVKDNIDPTRSGRLRVFVADDPSSQDSQSSDSWITVNYMSTFFGKVTPQAGDKGYGDYVANPSSYGMWHAPPDIGSTVICIFINGDSNYGFWIGCVPDAEALHMVPAIGASDNIIANEGEAESYGGAVRLPVTNINTNNSDIADSAGFLDAPRPIHSYSASIMNQQGVIRDPIRGPIGSSSQRETPSRVGWGISTPGRPIYEGGYNDESIASNLSQSKSEQLKVIARRGGHTIVMDDGDIIGRDQLVRIRTALGHQILMSDDGQTLMILHSNGQSYIELGKEGTVDVYSTNSINMRTQGDLNLHADQNVNIHAMENFNIQAKNLHINSEEDIKLRAGKDIKTQALSNFTIKAGAAFAAASGGDASVAAGGSAFINGAKVNLNSGSASTQPQAIDIIPIIAQTDTLYDEKKGFIAAPAKLLTIASRAPAHAPWANAGQGVDVKTDLNASTQLSPAPTPAAAAATAAGAETAPTPVAAATAASAPATPPISGALDQGTTSAVLGTVATAASAGAGVAAVTQGAAVVTTAAGAVAAVGAFAQSATQMASAGVLKPGSDALINGLVQSGANIEQAMPSALFSGATSGSQNLTSFTTNVTAQASSMVTNLQQAQTTLTAVGAITGTEAPSQVAGLVTAAATVGVGPTVQAIAQSAGTVVSGAVSSLSNVAGSISSASSAVSGLSGAASSLSGAVSGISSVASSLSGISSAASSLTGAVSGLSSVTNSLQSISTSGAAGAALSAIGAGVAAASLASFTGGLGGITGALNALSTAPSLTGLLDQTKGIATSAFDSIKESFKPLKAGVPQNLTQIAKEAAASAATAASQVSASSPLSGLAGAASSLSGAVSGVTGGLSSVTGAISSVTGGLSSVTNAVSGITGASSALSSVGNTLGSFNNSVAGITGAITATTNNLSAVVNTVSGLTTTVDSITALTGTSSSPAASITSTANAVTSAVNTVNAVAGVASVLSSGGPSALTNAAAVVQQGGAAFASSAHASGLSSLPGGVGAVASVVNNAVGAINAIPGTEKITGLIQTAQTAMMNGLPMPPIPGELNALASLASAGLPAGASAQLQSAISSLSAIAGGSIKLPTVGLNTTDRTSITAQTTSVLGNPKIPAPNLLGGYSQSANDQLIEKASMVFKRSEEIKAEIDAIDKKIAEAKKAYLTAQSELPAGDPKLASLLAAYSALVNDPRRKELQAEWQALLAGA